MSFTTRQAAQATARDHPIRHEGHTGAECLHCHHPILLFGGVGWVDTTPPYYGGCYDMCTDSISGQHEPR